MKIYLCEEGKLIETEVVKETEKQIVVIAGGIKYTLRKEGLPKVDDYSLTNRSVKVFAENPEEALNKYIHIMQMKQDNLKLILNSIGELKDKAVRTKLNR